VALSACGNSVAAVSVFSLVTAERRSMPGNKRWYLVANESGILFFREGKEACNKGQPLGAIKDLFYGREYPQAKLFKDNAIEVRIFI